MADLFKLFDGSFGSAGSSAVSSQDGSSFSGISPENDLVARLASGTDSVELLVDYSRFANFVTFNSAESYVNVTADEILNSYPWDGTADDLQAFINGLDGFQQYFLQNWPTWSGHLRLNPAVSSSYVSFTDFGVQSGVARTSFISPGTGSMSIQGWIDVPAMTGSNDVMVVFQKQRQGTTDGLTVMVSGSQVLFNVQSGSTTATVSASLALTGATFFAGVLDRSSVTGTLSLYSATTGTFPTLGSQVSMLLGSRFDLASGSFYIGSGSVTGQVVRPFTGSIDAVSVWQSARSSADLTGTFNRRTYSQPNLVAAWNFNEASPSTPPSYSSIVRDGSGHRLDGRLQAFFSGSRGSGSLHQDVGGQPILSLADPNVVSYVVTAQVSGNTYDKSNPSLIYNLFPDAFSRINGQSSDVFQNFALILARHFDRIKLYVGQLVNMRRVLYGSYDQAPDDILPHLADFMGWQLDGSFANTDAMRYFVSRGVRPGPSANVPLATQMSEIKAQLWRRVLLNLLYIYKAKGTRESVDALLRSYGIDSGFVRLKEYARKSETRVPAERVASEKSVYAVQFVSGATVSFTGR